ncbi:MAG: hypothetical protein AB4058_04095 [Microcystaceae cyanobacterium]
MFQQWRSLTARFGSPLYIYDLDVFAQRVTELQQALPTTAKWFYSLKCNPLPALVREAKANGCCLEVCSENELKVAYYSGISVDQILYSGPGKTAQEISQAIEWGVSYFSVESYTDLLRIDQAAQKAQQKVRLLLRINPEASLQGGLAMSGAQTQFGFEESVLLKDSQKLDELSPYSDLVGYHVYYGTQLESEEILLQAFTAGIECVERLSSQLNFQPQIIDLGGGFPWAYASKKQPISLANLRTRLEELLAKRKYSAEAEVWFESGRYLAASSGTLIATILDIKEGKNNSQFVVLDTGINHLGGMSGLGRIPRGYVFMYDLSTESEMVIDETVNKGKTFVVGPLCSPLDCLSRNANLPASAQVGDLVAIPNVGAYGLTASLVAFLTRPAPLEIALRYGQPVELYTLRTGHESVQINPQNLTTTIKELGGVPCG